MLAQFVGTVNTSLLPTVTFCIKLWEREATEPDLSPALSLERWSDPARVSLLVSPVRAASATEFFKPVFSLVSALLPVDMSSISSRILSSISSSAALLLVVLILPGFSSLSHRNRRFAPLSFYWIPTYCLVSVYRPVRAVDQFNHWLNST